MRSRQLESGARVVECAIRPANGIVATFTGSWEARRCMSHRSYSIRVVRLMARHAPGARQIVVVVEMAIRALSRRNCVRASQRKAGAVVVERRVRPRSRVVALLASLREI